MMKMIGSILQHSTYGNKVYTNNLNVSYQH